MISTKDKKMTPQERKEKVAELRKEHEEYFKEKGFTYSDVLYIPKMAYRPTGKDELYVSFFPSELKKERDIYTEFVSIDYDSEDSLRTLYLLPYNSNWEKDWEIIESSSGFQRHMVPVSDLTIIKDINSSKKANAILDFEKLPNPDEVSKEGQEWLKRIAIALEDIAVALSKK
tara:strand:+ start:6273 stop:6791 length:519 start_codon:yes stop_codon:yes gene_type:complete